MKTAKSKSENIFRNRLLTISRVGWDWWGLGINTGYQEHRPYARLVGFGLWISINLPQWILAPARRKVTAAWDAATVARMGRDWYWDETRREYDIGFHRDAFTIHYGVQPGCWPGDKVLRWTPPWMRWRHTETRYLDLDGSVFARHHPQPGSSYESQRALEATMPSATFFFSDFDGEEIAATVRIQESLYACGEGRWAWLAMIRRQRTHPRYDIRFSKETGSRKGSWKGGMTACNGPAIAGELHAAAFKRYCVENNMTLINQSF